MHQKTEQVTQKDIKKLMLRKLQVAKRKISHIPYIVSNHKRMVVWSDVKEILFISCANPKCTVVLNALKHQLNYPASEMYMHPCSQTEQLLFLRQFVIVTPGTLLVDISCLKNSENLMKLHDMVSVKHQKSKEASTFLCDRIAKSKGADSIGVYSNIHVGLLSEFRGRKRLLQAVTRELSASNDFDSHKSAEKTNSLEQGDSSRKIDGVEETGDRQPKTGSLPFVATVLCSRDDVQAEKALIPLALLREVYPEYLPVLEKIAHMYVRQCAKDVECVTQCSIEEGQKLSSCLAMNNGYDKQWFCVTSLSLMMSWAEFWRCCRSEDIRTRPVSRNVPVCLLNVQKSVDGNSDVDLDMHNKEQKGVENDDSSIGTRSAADIPLRRKNDALVINCDTKVIPKCCNISGTSLAREGVQAKKKPNGSLTKISVSDVTLKKNSSRFCKGLDSPKTSVKKHVLDHKIRTENLSDETNFPLLERNKSKSKLSNSRAVQTETVKNKINTSRRQPLNVTLNRDAEMKCQQKSDKAILKKNHSKSNSQVANKIIKKASERPRRNMKSSRGLELKQSQSVMSRGMFLSKSDPHSQMTKDLQKGKQSSRTALVKNKKFENSGCFGMRKDPKLSCLSEEFHEKLKVTDIKTISSKSISKTNKVKNIQSNRTVSDFQAEMKHKTSTGNMKEKTRLSQEDDNNNAKLEGKDENITHAGQEQIENRRERVNCSDQNTRSHRQPYQTLNNLFSEAISDNNICIDKEESDEIVLENDKQNTSGESKTFKDYLEASYENAIDIRQKMKTEDETRALQLEYMQKNRKSLAGNLELPPSQVHSSGIGVKVESRKKEMFSPFGVMKDDKFKKEDKTSEVIEKLKLIDKSGPKKSICCDEKSVTKNNNKEETLATSMKCPVDSTEISNRLKALREKFGDVYSSDEQTDNSQLKEGTQNEQCSRSNQNCANVVKNIQKNSNNTNSDNTDNYIVIPYDNFQASVNNTKPNDTDKIRSGGSFAALVSSTKPEHIDQTFKDKDTEMKNFKSSCFGSSSSRSPDIYDEYARHKKSKINRQDKAQARKSQTNAGNQTATITSKKIENTKTCSRGVIESTSDQNLRCAVLPGKLDKPNLTCDRCDKLFTDLIAVWRNKKQIKDNESLKTDQELKRSCSQCVLCQAEFSSSDCEEMMNQLVHHMLERMKSLKIDCAEETLNEKIGCAEENYCSDSVTAEAIARASEESTSPAEECTVRRRMSLLEKVSSFAEHSFDSEPTFSGEKSEPLTINSDKSCETDLTDMRLNDIPVEVNINQQGTQEELTLTGKDFFTPMNKSVNYKTADKETSSRAINGKSSVLTDAELYCDIKDSTYEPLQKQADAQIVEKSSSPISFDSDPDGLEDSEIIQSYQNNPRRYGKFPSSDIKIKAKQSLASRTCSPTPVNVELSIYQRASAWSPCSKGLVKDLKQYSMMKNSERTKQFLSCQAAKKKKRQNIISNSMVIEKVAERNKIDDILPSKSVPDQTYEASKTPRSIDVSSKSRPKTSVKSETKFTTVKQPLYTDPVYNMCLLNDILSKVNANVSNIPEKGSSQEPRTLRNRSSKSAKTAKEVTSNQTIEREIRFAERQKRQSGNDVLAAVSAVAKNTFETTSKETSISVKSQNRQQKLRKHIHAEIKKKKRTLRRKTKSAPVKKQHTASIRKSPAADEEVHLNNKLLSKSRDSKVWPTSKASLTKTSEENKNTGEFNQQTPKRKSEQLNVSDEQQNHTDANLNNNFPVSSSLESTELNKDNANKVTASKVKSSCRERKRNSSKSSDGLEETVVNTADSGPENIEIELDIDEVVDWELPFDYRTGSPDEITFTITHIDGTQLIVSNKHPDFANIVKFVEEQKRNCGEDSITVEAELNLSLEDSKQTELGMTTLTLKQEEVVEPSYQEEETIIKETETPVITTSEPAVERCLNVCEDEAAFTALQQSDDCKNQQNETYSICDAFKDMLSAEFITRCFMNDDTSNNSDNMGFSSVNDRGFKHHDNIFEAFAPEILNMAEGKTLPFTGEIDMQDSFLNYLLDASDFNLATLEKKAEKLITKDTSPFDPNEHLRNSFSILDESQNHSGMECSKEQMKEETYGMTPSDLTGNEIHIRWLKDESAVEESPKRNIIPETLAKNSTIMYSQGSFNQRAVGCKEVKKINELGKVEKSLCPSEEPPKLHHTTTLINEWCSIYPEIKELELLTDMKESSDIEKNHDDKDISSVTFGTTTEENKNKHREKNLFNESKLDEDVGKDENVDPDQSKGSYGLDSIKSKESLTDLEDTYYDHSSVCISDDAQSDKISLAHKGEQKQKQKKRKKKSQTQNSAKILLKDIVKCDSHKGENFKSATVKENGRKKEASVDTLVDSKENMRHRKRSVKPENDEEDEEEEEKRREKEEQTAAEGFIKTQQKYMDIILNKSTEVQRTTRTTVGNKSAISSTASPRSPGFVIESLPEGVPVHGDRQCYKIIGDATRAAAGDNDSDDDEEVWIEDAANSCRYQLIDDEEGLNLGGLAFYKELVFPYVYINGYKFTPLKDALQCFRHCQAACAIPRSVLNQNKGLVKSLSTWDQVYKLELIKMKKGHGMMTGDTLVKLDSFLALLPELTREIVRRHRNTTLKRSQNCSVVLYGVKV